MLLVQEPEFLSKSITILPETLFRSVEYAFGSSENGYTSVTMGLIFPWARILASSSRHALLGWK
jgi:hypothetical protein